MKRSPLPRRLAAVTAGLVIGLGSALMLNPPALAQDDTGSERRIVDCQLLTFEADRTGQDSIHAWRAVLRDDQGVLLRVVWQSGDWAEDADLGTDPDALVDNGWTTEGSFEVQADIDNAPNGTITLEYWNTTAKKSGEAIGWKRWGHGPKIRWSYENPCGWVGEPTVTQPTCDTAGTIEVPARDPEDPSTGGLTYRINGEEFPPGVHNVEPGTYEVVALRVGGVKNYQKKWTIVMVPPECDEPTPAPSTEPSGEPSAVPSAEPSVEPSPEPSSEPGGEGGGLPVTGPSTMLVAGGALALLSVGAGLFLLARRRRITFTA